MRQTRRWLRSGCAEREGLAGDVRRQMADGCSDDYRKFTSQEDMGHFLVKHYKIRTPKDLTSCEVCHR